MNLSSHFKINVGYAHILDQMIYFQHIMCSHADHASGYNISPAVLSVVLDVGERHCSKSQNCEGGVDPRNVHSRMGSMA
jgi:hypothetical protein